MTYILDAGRNCWRTERADKLHFIVDGTDYFRLLREALKRAEQSIYILSWDINSQIKLIRDGDKDGYPDGLGELLNFLAEEKPDLQVYILNWDFAVLYTLDRELLPTYKLDWKTHERIHFRLDNDLPEGASQHQKIVVIDEALAFIGGLDLTTGRWDTSDHLPHNPRRDRIDGKIARPYHDAVVMVDGDAACALADLVKERWQKVTGQVLPANTGRRAGVPWPETITPDAENVMIGLARTQAAYKEQPEIREIKQLYRDAISSAREYIYIENQYFTAPSIGDAVQASLEQEKGPEIVVVMPINTDGWLSQNTMDVFRIRLIRRLRDHDAHHRLRVYYPDGRGLDANPINVHAKIMIVDDRLVTVGSANLNNRSMGLDSECNIVLEANSDPAINKAIATFRDRLMAEHLGCTPEQVRDTMERERSLIAAIRKRNNTKRRYLHKLSLNLAVDLDRMVPEGELVDPEHPLRPELMIRHMMPEEDRKPARLRIVIWLILIGAIAAMSAMWRWTPLNEWLSIDALSGAVAKVRDMPFAPVWVVSGFVLAGLVAFPFLLLIIATVIVFGPVKGFIFSLAGGIASAIVVYWIGDLLGRNTVHKMAGSRLNKISRKIAEHGILNIVFVRIVPVAPFTIVNLVAGASHINFRDYLLGTLLGMIPGMAAVTLISDRVKAIIDNPALGNTLWLVVTVALVAFAAYMLLRWLRRSARGDDSRNQDST